MLNGVLTLNNANNLTKLVFTQGVQTLSGTGQVVLTGAYSGRNPTGLRRPDDAHGRLRTSRFRGAGSILQNVNSSLINQGTIAADVAGQRLSLEPNLNSFTNDGTMRAVGGGILEVACNWTNNHLIEATASTVTIAGNWRNTGTISEISSTLHLGGAFKTSTMGTVTGSGGAINFTGTLTNDGELTLHGAVR